MTEKTMTQTEVEFRKIVVEAGAEENLLDAETIENDKSVDESEDYEIDVTEEEAATIKEVMTGETAFVVHQDQGIEDRGGFTGGPSSHDSFQPGEYEAEVEFDELVEIDFETAKLNEADMTFTFTVKTYANYRYYRY